MSDAIVLDGLVRRFGTRTVLGPLSLRLEAGRCIGLIGPNGAGKTTLFSILCGFLRPTDGTARVLGHDPFDRRLLGKRVGILPQDAPLPRRPVRESLCVWAELSGVPIRQVGAHVDGWLDRVGLREVALQRADTLSHGMAKRVAIAQAFLGNPELVLLDEPTAGLDPRHAALVKDVLRTEKKGRTLVISSHELAQLEELCDHVVILDRGRLVSSSSLGALVGHDTDVLLELPSDWAPRARLAVDGLGWARWMQWDEGAQRAWVRLRIANESQRIDPSHPVPPSDVFRAIPMLLRALLEADVPVLGVQRGRGLEAAVLQRTSVPLQGIPVEEP